MPTNHFIAHLYEDEAITYVADNWADNPVTSLTHAKWSMYITNPDTVDNRYFSICIPPMSLLQEILTLFIYLIEPLLFVIQTQPEIDGTSVHDKSNNE